MYLNDIYAKNRMLKIVLKIYIRTDTTYLCFEIILNNVILAYVKQ